MWRVHALDDGVDASLYIPVDAIVISEAEAMNISAQPPSEEYKAAIAEGVAALGGRNATRYPTREVKEAIGAICVNSSHIEVSLRTIIWHVSGVGSDVGMALTGGNLAIYQLTDMLSVLLKQRYPALSEKAAPILKRLTDLNTSRGKYVHGLWSPGKSGGIMVGKPFLKRSRDQGQFEEITLDQLHDVAEGYMQVESDLMIEILHPLLPQAK